MKHAKELRHFLSWIEKRYGGVPIDTGAAAEVIVANNKLETAHLKRLLSHQALAIHIPNYYYPNATKLGDALIKESKNHSNNWKVCTNRGLESSDVYTLGHHPPYNVSVAQNQQEQYFEKVPLELECRRQDNVLYPLDKLRLNLDELWPSGAGLARNNNNQVFSGGLPRIMEGPTRWKHGFIHVDDMNVLNKHSGLFSANIYLKVPPEGGAGLQIWPVAIRSRWDWYRNAILLSGLSTSDPEAQVRLRLELGTPVTISVQSGDLVLFCVQRPHAAMGFVNGTRVSLQCFIQHDGMDKRLLIDS